MPKVKPLSVKSRGGQAVAVRLLGRVGDTEIHEATEEGVQSAIRLFVPEGVLARDRTGALKLADPAFKTEFARATARFLTLGRKLRDRLDPHWLRVRDAMPAEGTAVWITDRPPPSLAEIIAERGLPPPEAVLAFAASLVRALDALHVVAPHLDLSPDTIGIGDDGEVVLMHPSVDRRPFIGLTGTNANAVRPGYSPIEAYDGAQRQPLDALTDIYAASAVLRYLVTGVEPRPWMNRRAHHGGLQPGDHPTYPVAFIYAVNRGFSVRRDDRMGSLAEWSAGLLVSGDSDPAYWIAPPAPLPEPEPEPVVEAEPLAEAEPDLEAPAEAELEAPPPIPVPVVAAADPIILRPPPPPSPPPPAGPSTLALPPKPAARGGRGGAVVTMLVVGGLLAAGGFFAWQGLKGDDAYYATREIRVRATPDPRTGRVVAQPGRGFSFEGKPAGRHGGIDWIEITDGPYKGAYVNAPNVSRTPPPTLTTTFPRPRQAQVLRGGFAYRAPISSSAQAGPIAVGQTLAQTGLLSGGWVEVQWPQGGVAYVPASAFEPTYAAADPGATDTAANDVGASVEDGERTLDLSARSGTSAITTRPTWFRTPTQAQLDDAAPQRLFDEGIEGRIVVDCEADPEGALRDCRLVSETPAGYGMVAAARKVLPHYVMAITDAEGEPTAGRRYRVSVTLGPRNE